MEEDALTCLGTQPIELQWNSSMIPGMLAAFALPDDHQANLELIITDGASTFRGSIPTNDVKGSENWHQQGKTPREALVSCLLREQQGINNDDDDSESKKSCLTFMYKGLEDSLKIVIKGETPNGLVLSLWTGEFQKTTAQVNSNHKLSFARILGKCLNVEKAKNSQLTKRIDALEKDLHGWKDTVSKLEETTWQTEKDELLQRFLVLYNQSKAELRKAKQQVESLEEERKQKSRIQQQVPTVATKSPFTVFHDDEADEDDDVEPYDPELVAQLAAGPSKKAVKATTTKADPPPVDTSSRVSSSISPSKKTRINPHTGAIEVWDASTIFDDEDDTDADVAAEESSPSRRRKADNEDSSTDHRPLKRSRMEDDSETGDEDD